MNFGHAAAQPLAVPKVATLDGWAREIGRQSDLMRCRRPLFDRFDATARQLSAAMISACADLKLVDLVDRALREARHPTGRMHWLDRVWTRAELGALIAEATNRARQLRMGRVEARACGPRLDPRFIPDDRLEALIQRHRDLAVVEALRAERRARQMQDAA